MIQVNRIYLIFNRLVTKKFLVDTSDAISLNKISYIPAQLFRASMKVLHSICNIFAFQMKKQMLADDRGD